MTPERLTECLRLVRWHKDVLAEAMDVPSETVTAWLAGTALFVWLLQRMVLTDVRVSYEGFEAYDLEPPALLFARLNSLRYAARVRTRVVEAGDGQRDPHRPHSPHPREGRSRRTS